MLFFFVFVFFQMPYQFCTSTGTDPYCVKYFKTVLCEIPKLDIHVPVHMYIP